MNRREFLKSILTILIAGIGGGLIGRQINKWLQPKPKKGLKLGKGIYEQMKEGNIHQYKQLDIKELEKTIADFYWSRPKARTQMVWFNGKMYEI
jgi:hypothetical protein